MHTNRMLLAEAQATHGGDRAALLAAIDEAAASISSGNAGNRPSGGFKLGHNSSAASNHSSAMMKSAQVN